MKNVVIAAYARSPFTPANKGALARVRPDELAAQVVRGLLRKSGVDAALMIHPRGGTRVWRPSLGLVKVKAEFFGKAAHAASSPWQGANALNAVIQLFVALDALRQQLRPDARIHGVITHGGDQPNIIPEYTAAEFYLRSERREYLHELLRRFEACARAAATATGCGVNVTPDPQIHDPLKPNLTMSELFRKNLERIGVPEDPEDPEAGYGSTDCGNVSQAIPTIHPYIRIAPDGVPLHSREFAEWAKSPLARAGMLAGAKALALTALDLLADPDALRQAKAEFART